VVYVVGFVLVSYLVFKTGGLSKSKVQRAKFKVQRAKFKEQRPKNKVRRK
jgi:hypothetical protein